MPTLLSALEDERIAGKKFDFYGGQKFAEPFIAVAGSSADDYQHVGRAIIDTVSRDLTILLANGEITAEEAHARFISSVQDELDFL
jgi:hypothetical protein